MNTKKVFHEANEVTMFMMPLLGLSKKAFKYPSYNRVSLTRFINAYLTEKDTIEILTYGYRDKFYNTFREQMMATPYFKAHRELVGGGYDLWEMKFPRKKALKAFKQGKYSEIPIKDKQLIILNSMMSPKKVEIIGRVLSKDPVLRELREQEFKAKIPKENELWSLYDPQWCMMNEEIEKILLSTLGNKILDNVRNKGILDKADRRGVDKKV